MEYSWKYRIDLVLECPDNRFIPRVQNAGKIVWDTQIMYNGLKIHAGSYYGAGNNHMLFRNKGVHEPQEEKAFNEVLRYVKPNSSMLELGSFWAFYSMTFQKVVDGGANYLVEPDPHALLSGKNNFRLNNMGGRFFNFSVSDKPDNGPVKTITVDEFVLKTGIDKLAILHSDIQGAEFKMLGGSTWCLDNKIVDFFFISTHSDGLHHQCISELKRYGYVILCDANLDESYSWDGLIVAKSPLAAGPNEIEISKRGISTDSPLSTA